jgi:hypothetical protein
VRMVHHSTSKLDELLSSIYDAFKPAPGSSDKENEAAAGAGADAKREVHPLGSKRVIRTFLAEVRGAAGWALGVEGRGWADVRFPERPPGGCARGIASAAGLTAAHAAAAASFPPVQAAEKVGGLWVCKPKYVDKWKLAKEVPDALKPLLPGSAKKKRACLRGSRGAWGRGGGSGRSSCWGLGLGSWAE